MCPSSVCCGPRRLAWVSAVSCLLLAFGAASVPAAVTLPDTGLFAPIAAQWRERVAETKRPARGEMTLERLEALLEAGDVDGAYAALARMGGAKRAADVARARVLLARAEFKQLTPVLTRLAALPQPTELERRALYVALAACDDGARIDTLTRLRLAADPGGVPEWLAAGKLAYDLLDYARAESCFTRALALRPAGAEAPALALRTRPARAVALVGQALVLQKRRDWDRSLEKLREAVGTSTTTDGLMALAETLIRLGRTDEAISACEWAVRMSPYGASAHYMLGNGYARKNYTELLAAYPKAFADEAGRREMAKADGLLAAGRRDAARGAYRRLHETHPGWADAAIRLASLDWEDARYREARALCFRALSACPEYGRAHAVLAKAIESLRFEVDVHRADYERRFAAAPMPRVPGIEQFVLNWESLSPRHQKRVAQSIVPWSRFIPVLVEGGSTYHIKPLYMLLSETPGQESLKDQRIEYDSRLWDDVRGAGGYHTVTGIEDVERTVFDRDNTVLHELSHQVHAVFTADQNREIQEHYRRAKVRDDSSRDGFLSRYAGGSVYEYFAEGANAIESPMRDAYDPREVVLERLERMDSDLLTLVKRLLALTDVNASYPVAYVNAGGDQVTRGLVNEGLAYYRKALVRSPKEETALQSLVSALMLGNRGPEAAGAADSALAVHPTSGELVRTSANAYWHGGRGADSAAALLAHSRATVRREDRYQIDLARGSFAWTRGDAAASLAAYDSVLAYQSDQPEGLWGRASALALAKHWDEAFAAYDKAVRMRTGVAGLRCDYAFDLLRAGRVAAARAQLDAARLLDAEHPTAEALRGWAALLAGDAAGARTHANQALAWGPWSDLARIVLGKVELAAGDTAAADAALAPVRERIRTNAPPGYEFRPRIAAWERTHALPAVERALVP